MAVDHSGNLFMSSFVLGTPISRFRDHAAGCSNSIAGRQGSTLPSIARATCLLLTTPFRKSLLTGRSSTYANTNFAFGITVLVPEPTALVLAALGFAALVAWWWRKRDKRLAPLQAESCDQSFSGDATFRKLRIARIARGMLVLIATITTQSADADIMLVANPAADEVDEIAPGGAVTTFASGFFGKPLNVVASPDGTVFVVSQYGYGNDFITRISPSGAQDSLARVESGVIAVDSQDDVFLNNFAHLVDGVVSPSATTLIPGGLVKILPDGSAIQIAPALPEVVGPVAFNNQGDLFSIDGTRIVEISPSGTSTPIARTTGTPVSFEFDHAGNIFVTELVLIGNTLGPELFKISPQGVETALPSIAAGVIGVDSHGDVFSVNKTITEIAPDGTVSIYANTSFASGVAFLVPEPFALALAVAAIAALVVWYVWGKSLARNGGIPRVRHRSMSDLPH